MGNIGTFGSFTQARLGIYAAYQGLNVTGNNISNINTEGYTRQRLEQTSLYSKGADRYYASNGARVGYGVICTGVSQLRDPYLDIRYRNELSSVGAMDAKLAGLENIQRVLDETGDGDDDFGIIEAQLSDLYDALSKLSDQTGHEHYDIQVRASAEALCKQLNSYAGQLEDVYNNALTSFNEDLGEVNGILNNIRDLNTSIRKSEIHGDPALEQRDERNMLIDQLSKYMKIDVIYTEEDIGAGQTVEKLTIQLANANPDGQVTTDSTVLVDGIYAAQLEVDENMPQLNPKYDPTYVPKNDTDTDIRQFKYLVTQVDANGDPVKDQNGDPVLEGTNDPKKANQVENTFLNMTVTELKDSKDRVQYTIEGPTQGTATKEDYDKYKPSTTSVPDADGVITITTYQRTDTGTTDPVTGEKIYNYSTQIYTKKPSKSVSLDDNDLYGSLQSQRELLTDAGEFTDPEIINIVDENAASKRGYAYYQKSLDLLAKQLASVFNDANQGYYVDENGYYLDNNTKKQVLLDDQPISKNGLTDTQKAALEADGKTLDEYLEEKGCEKIGAVLFSNRSDGDETDGITASNISISKTWLSGPQVVSSFVIPVGMDAPASTDSSNIEHLKYLVTYEKMNYYPTDEALAAKEPMFHGTFQEMWQNIGSTLGKDMKVTSTRLDTFYASSVELNTARDSVSSVDLNDEAMNLMQYSKSYNAACRLMTTIDSVLDKLINNTGMTT